MTSEVVWDASAVLAVINQESGWQKIAGSLQGGSINAVNLSEVAAKLAEIGMPEGEVREVLDHLPLTVHPFSRDLAIRTGLLRPATKSKGLSLGDRACLAFAAERSRPALTTDRAWKDLDLGIEILIGR